MRRRTGKGRQKLAVSAGVPPSTDIMEVSARIAAIRSMKHGPLKELYRQHFGVIPETHNAKHLRRKLMAKVQLDAIPKHEQERLEVLEPKALAILRRRVEARRQRVSKVAMAATEAKGAATATTLRDPRLPEPGTVLLKKHKADTHEVIVHLEDFEWNGKRYQSLSKIAFEITGTKWNGMLYFGLTGRKAPRMEAIHA